MSEYSEEVQSIQEHKTNESPLLRLATRPESNGKPYIDAEQFAAGELLRRDFEWAQLAPRVTMSYERVDTRGDRHWQMSDNAIERLGHRAIAARQRVFAAFDAVGPELSGIMYHVCCLAGGVEAAERHLTLPRRAGRAVLAMALTRLARHYCIKKPARQSGTGPMGHWAVADYKPVIMPMPAPQPHQP